MAAARRALAVHHLARAVGRRGDGDVHDHLPSLEQLQALLVDPVVEVRRAAAVALGWLANDYAVEALQTAAQVDDSAPVREAAQAALDKIARANAQRR